MQLFWYADNLPKLKDIDLSFENDGLFVERAKSAVSAIDLPGQLIESLRYKKLASLVSVFESSYRSIERPIRK